MNALLGGIIGGALEQGGKAAYRSIAEDAELERKMQMENHRSKIEEDRAMRLEAIRGAREDKNYARQRTDTVADKKDERTYQTGRDEAGHVRTLERDTQSQLHASSQTDKQIAAQAAQSGASRAQSAAHHEASMALQRDSLNKPVVMTLGDGSIVSYQAGKMTAVSAPDGSPAKGSKDVSAGNVILAKSLLADQEKEPDPVKAAAIGVKIQQLLGGGKSADAGAGALPVPTPDMTGVLQKALRNKDPAVRDAAKASFGKTYGEAALIAASKGIEPPGDKKDDPIPPPGPIPSAMPPMGEAADNPKAIIAREAKGTANAARAAQMTTDLASRTAPGPAARILKEIGKELDPEVRAILEKRAQER